MTANNIGPSTAVDVGANDPLPDGIHFVSSMDGCTAIDQVVTCTSTAAVLPGELKSFTFTVQATAANSCGGVASYTVVIAPSTDLSAGSAGFSARSPSTLGTLDLESTRIPP